MVGSPVNASLDKCLLFAVGWLPEVFATELRRQISQRNTAEISR